MSARNGSNGKTEYRRRLVAAALIEHPNVTQRQLQEQIGKAVLNPETDEPYSLGTINNDIRAIRDGWREKANDDYDDWIAGELAKLDRLEEAGWRINDYDLVLKCMSRRAKLLGLDKPQRLSHEGTGEGGAIVVANVELTDAERRAALAGMFGLSTETDG